MTAQIRARDLGDRMLLIGTEHGVDPPLSLVGDEYKRWKGKEEELDCLFRGRVGGEGTPSECVRYL